MNFELINNEERWVDLAEDWQALFKRSSTPTQLFLEWHWVNGWWQHIGRHRGCALSAVVARKSNQVVMIWPWVLSRRAGLRILEPMGGLLSCYDDALLDNGYGAKLLEQAWEFLRKNIHHDVAELRGVHEEAKIATTAQRLARKPIAITTAPFVDVAQHSNYVQYIASRPKKMRQNQRRSAKYLGQQGQISGSGNDSTMPVATAIEHCLKFKQDWLKVNGLSGKEIMEPEAARFLHEVCSKYQREDTATQLCISTLYLDEQPISVGIGLRLHNRHCEYLAGFDHRFERFGPGRLRMASGIEDCFMHGIERYDMLTPETSFKRIWTESKPQVAQYMVAASLKGRMYRDLYTRKLRPKIKQLYNALPASMRKALR